MVRRKRNSSGAIFKPKDRLRDGTLVKTAWYHVRWTDARGRQHIEAVASSTRGDRDISQAGARGGFVFAQLTG